MNSIFEQLTKRQIKRFFDIHSSIKDKDFSFIEKKYLENERHFDSTLSFLQGIGLYKKQKDKIILKNKLVTGLTTEEKLDSFLIEKILEDSSAFSKDVYSYIQNFKSKNNSLIYQPSEKKNLAESGLRNFLIDIDLVFYQRSNKHYVINEKYLHLISTKIATKSLSPKALKHILKNQEEIGNLAELEIIEFEKNRLKNFPQLASKIEHVATNNVNAGYDIKSWEENNKERYIEVKAVSLADFKFYWSRNEIDKSQHFKNQYYLYLLPVVNNKLFDTESLKIIQNPFNKIFKKHSDWNNQIEQYSIWRED